MQVMVTAIAIVGAGIAWQQMLIARTRLQFDLYDRRYKIFQAARNLLACFVRDGNLSYEEIAEFVLGISDAVFLFDDKMADYLSEMHKRGIDMQIATRKLSEELESSERDKILDDKHEQEMWFARILDSDDITERFKPYLRLQQIDPWKRLVARIRLGKARKRLIKPI